MTVSVGGDSAMLLFQCAITYNTVPGCLGAEPSDHLLSCDIDKKEDGLFLVHSRLDVELHSRLYVELHQTWRTNVIII